MAAVRLPSPKRSHDEAFAADRPPFLHPTSPSHEYRTGLPSALPSPGARAPDDAGREGPFGGLEDKKPQKMARSSIACARCRRSKVKCKQAYPHVCPRGE